MRPRSSNKRMSQAMREDHWRWSSSRPIAQVGKHAWYISFEGNRIYLWPLPSAESPFSQRDFASSSWAVHLGFVKCSKGSLEGKNLVPLPGVGRGESLWYLFSDVSLSTLESLDLEASVWVLFRILECASQEGPSESSLVFPMLWRIVFQEVLGTSQKRVPWSNTSEKCSTCCTTSRRVSVLVRALKALRGPGLKNILCCIV